MEPCSSTENIGPLLARANLLRMRGMWSDAAETCAEALRRSPRNPTAHSLLGDIYQDQGRAEEARHWYHLALEQNPGSEADRAKLARVEEMLEARQQRAEWQAIIEGKRQPVATSLLVRETVQRIGAIAGAALCGIILVAATLLSVAEHRADAGLDPGLPTPSLGRRQARPLTPETRTERDLLARVSGMTRSGYAQPVRVTVDPRTGGASLRVFLSPKAREGVTTPSFRTRVLREAYRSAYVLHAADANLTSIQVYVVGGMPQPSGAVDNALLLVGNVSVKDLWESPDTIEPEKINAAFNETSPLWWAVDLRGM